MGFALCHSQSSPCLTGLSEAWQAHPAVGEDLWGPTPRRHSFGAGAHLLIKSATGVAENGNFTGIPLHRDPGAVGKSARNRSAVSASTRAVGDANPAPRPTSTPSSAASRENRRMARYAAKMDRGTEASRSSHRNSRESSVGAGGAADATPDLDQLEEDFQEQVSSVGALLEDLKSGVRMEHLSGGRRVPELDVHEAPVESRSVRREHHVVQTPKAKVAMRLEQCRQLEGGSADQASIPMVKVGSSSLGSSQQWLVDVHALRSRCQQLEEGANFNSLMRMRTAREKKEKQTPPKTPNARRASSTPALCPVVSPTSSEGLGLSWPPSSTEYRDRLQRVRSKKQVGQFDSMLRKLGAMRSEPTDTVLESFEVLAQRVASENLDVESRLDSLAEERTSRKAAFIRSTMELPERIFSHTKDIAANFQKAMVETSSGSETPSLRASRKSSTIIVEQEVPASKAEGQRRLWRLLRGVCCVLLVYLAHRRKANAAVVVKLFLQEFGEWARVKRVMHKLMFNVCLLQSAARSFVAYKRASCAQMVCEWRRIEDNYLSRHFKRYLRSIMDDRPELQDILQLQTKDLLQFSGIDWRQFRIPEKERLNAVRRWYSTQLLRHVRAVDAAQRVVTEALCQHIELNKFLMEESSGSSDPFKASAAAELQNMCLPAPRNFWSLSEAKVLEMIQEEAKALHNVEPFQQHPVNAGSRSRVRRSKT